MGMLPWVPRPRARPLLAGMLAILAIGWRATTRPGPSPSPSLEPERQPEPQPEPKPEPKPPVLRLSARAHPCAPASQGLPIGFELRNESPDPIPVLPALDGSMEGMRLPLVTLELRDQAGHVFGQEGWRRCAFVNRVRLADFAVLAEGESIDPTRSPFGMAPDDSVLPPGTYTAKLIYEIHGPELGRGAPDLAHGSPLLRAFVSALPSGRWVSNEVRFRLVGPHERCR
jgi:hypothetical protein